MTTDLIDEGVTLNSGTGGQTIGVEAVPSGVAATTIAAGSNGASLPQATIFAASTAGFPSSGTIMVTTAGGTFPVNYTGVTAGSFTGTTGGSGVMSTGGAIVAGALVEIVKILLGADGVNAGFVASGNPMPVTTTQLPAALVGGRLDTNIGSWLGSTAPTVGQKTAANSLPVVLQSDLASAGGVKITDGTNTQPTADVAARKLFAGITDGTNTAAVKAASTAAVAADPALVVTLSPNNPPAALANGTAGPTALNALNAAVSLATLGQQGVSFFLSAGTLIGTIIAEVSSDNGTTWIQSFFIDATLLSSFPTIVFASTNGTRTRTIAVPPGTTNARVRVSAFTSGTANGNLKSTQIVSTFHGVFGVGSAGTAATGAPVLTGGTDQGGSLQSVQMSGAAPAVGVAGVVVTPGKMNTYRAAITGLAVAAAATDIFTLSGSGPARIRLKSMRVTGTQTTAGPVTFQLIKRSAADTGGTSTAPTRVPMLTGDTAPTSTLAAYTVNPTLGTAVGLIGSKIAFLPGAASVSDAEGVEWHFADFETQADLTSAAEVFCLNLNGVTVTGGAINVEVEWTEN